MNDYFLTQRNDYIQEDWYYEITKPDGKRVAFCRRNEALNYYKFINGTKLEIVYKDIDKTRKTIIDGKGLDIERVKNDLSIKKTTKNQRKAIEQWNKANTRQIALKLNKNADKDILDYLDKLDNKNGFIKDLIRKHIEEENKAYTYILTNNQLNEKRYKRRIYC